MLEPLLPVGRKAGRPPLWAKRKLIDGIRWRLRTGAPWRDVPERYGPWQTVYGLFRRWQREGVWARILVALQARADAKGLITWDVSVDSTIVRAHHHAAGARKEGDVQKEPPGGARKEPDDHGLGRSRGGLSTKMHLAVEQGQKLLSVVFTAGQRGDSPQFRPVLEGIRVPRPGGGRPRTRPDRVRAGAVSDAPSLKRRIRQLTAAHVDHAAADLPPSTRSTTASATPSSVRSTGSSATAPWPRGTTSWPSAMKRPCISPASTSGCDQGRGWDPAQSVQRWPVCLERGRWWGASTSG
ncbi:IS5 family transposase [Nonomuraea bangladeshensis]